LGALQASRQEKDDQALGLALRIRDDFPEQPAETNYLVAVLYARTAQPLKTLETFESGLDEGMAWNEALLRRSPSLASIQPDPRFKVIVERSDARLRALETTTTVELAIAAPPNPNPMTPLLMPLHGGADTLEEFAPFWLPASSAGIVVCVPQSSQRRTTETFWWGVGETFDQERSEADLTFAYGRALREWGGAGPVVFGGYSQGAVMAVTFALQQRPFSSRGFICVAPGTSKLEPLVPLMEPAADRGVHGWILAGEQDPSPEQIIRLHQELTAHGVPCGLEIEPGLGHEFPADFASRLPSAIHFVLD